jgi:hypothetical protein
MTPSTFEPLESRVLLSVTAGTFAVGPAVTTVAVDGDSISAGPDGENVQGGPADGQPESAGRGGAETPEAAGDPDNVQDPTGQDTTTTTTTTTTTASTGDVFTAVMPQTGFGRRAIKTPVNVLHTYADTVSSLTIHVTAEAADGTISGTIATGTGTAAVTSPFTGTVRGRGIQITASAGSVTLRGQTSKDGSSIRGSLTRLQAGRHTHSRVNAARTA